MTSKNQVSPVIRISRGERDASARATHLKAASKKYLETTIERKQMSTTTNFKRIALVAVAALGLGVLSSVPSQATINADTVTLSSPTAAQTTAETFTASSAVATVTFFGAIQDSMSITAELLSTTAVGNTSLPALRLIETSSAVIDSIVGLVGTTPTLTNYGAHAAGQLGVGVTANTAVSVTAASSSVTTTAKFAVYLAGPAAVPNAGLTAAPAQTGTYVIRIKPAAIGKTVLVGSTNQTLTITVTAAPAQSTALSATNTKIWMQDLVARADLASQDSAIVARATASTAAVSGGDVVGKEVANIWINGRNASNIAFANLESVTATISGPGSLGRINTTTVSDAVPTGRSLLVQPNTDFVTVYSDGTSGVATITFTGATSGVALGTKTVTFSGVTVASMAAPTIAATDSKVIEAAAGTFKTTTVSVRPLDAAGNLVAGLTPGTASTSDFFAFSSDTSVVTVAYSGTFSATTGYAFTVTGVAVGSATISFGNAATLAASTIRSAASPAVRVGTALPSNVTVTTDKATYAPGEKMTVTVTILDAAGNALVGRNTYADIFSATGIVPSANLSGTNTLPNATNGVAVANYSNTTNTRTYEVFAPVTGGAMTLSWTGGTGLATANQVARTVSFTVTDSGAAALAAVTALATTVASLRTLIVTLTNLVLKIQKKVRA
jgi:trimeric autotransporter adhesin